MSAASLCVYNDYARMVGELSSQIALAAAIDAANTDVEDADASNTPYDNSIDTARAIYNGLNDLHSSLELLVETIPEESFDETPSSEELNRRYDQTAERIIAWQREIMHVMVRLDEYVNLEIDPKNADSLLHLLRTLPQTPQ